MAKQVTDRESSAESVAAAADTHTDKIRQAFEDQFKKHLQGKEKMPDMGLALALVGRALRATSEALVEASRVHDAELADDAAPREARDSAAAELVSLTVGIRSTVDTVYGQAGLKALGLDGRTPTDSKAILEHARNLVQRLSDPALVWPKALQSGVKLSPGVWVNELEDPVKRLTEARKDVAREEREAQATGVAKAKAMSAQDAMFSAGAAFISATLSLVGERDLADKTRPSTRRAGTTAALEEAGAGAGDGGAAEGGASTRSKRESPLRKGHCDLPGGSRSVRMGSRFAPEASAACERLVGRWQRQPQRCGSSSGAGAVSSQRWEGVGAPRSPRLHTQIKKADPSREEPASLQSGAVAARSAARNRRDRGQRERRRQPRPSRPSDAPR